MKRIKDEQKKNKQVKPFLKWVGGKGQLLPEIEKRVPYNKNDTITRYVEPFLGGGSVLFFFLNNFQLEEIYVNDLNKDLINTYLTVQNNVEPLIHNLKIFQEEYSRKNEEEKKEYYYLKRDVFNFLRSLKENTDEEKIMISSLFIFLNRTCYNGLYRVNKKGGFNSPAGRYKNPLICDEENLRNVSRAIKNVHFSSKDYSELISVINENTFVYLDPPYKPLTDSSSFVDYTSEKFGDKEQEDLARFVQKINEKGANFLLSNSDPSSVDNKNTFFDELYQDFSIERVLAKRNINSKGERREKVNELMIFNFEKNKGKTIE